MRTNRFAQPMHNRFRVNKTGKTGKIENKKQRKIKNLLDTELGVNDFVHQAAVLFKFLIF